MMNRLIAEFGLARSVTTLVALLALPAAAWAQVPVDENGDPIGNFEALSTEPATGNEEIPLLSTVDLEELVGPIALYPDDLLAIVLPAAAYPLQIVDAARFLERLEDDPSLEPNAEWDDSVVALTNYPEVIELLNEDIDWTWRLGEAVVSQQADVVGAIETFRDRAYAAGNLKSDSYQNVSRDEGVIEITPIAEDVIYVPYYEPERVVVYQPRPVYYYYPRPYPVYYYPYSSAHAFHRGYFWGVTTAFTIGWYNDSLNVFHHSYYGHPYYGHSYRDRWWYRRPTINIYNNHYVGGDTTVTVNHHNRGDRWQARGDRREQRSDRRITRNRSYPIRRQSVGPESVSSSAAGSRQVTRGSTQRRRQDREPIAFRERPATATIARGTSSERRDRGATARRTVPRSSVNAARTRTETNQSRRQSQEPIQVSQQRRTVGAKRMSKERRTNPTPKLRRTQPVVQSQRNEPARQSRRTERVAQTRRSVPATRPTRRAEPAAAVRRSQPAAAVRRSQPAAADVRRAEPSRPAARQEPQRQKKSAAKSAPARESRKSSDRPSQRRR